MSEGPAHPSAPGGVPTPEAVSFSEQQRESLRALAASMSFVGVCLMLFGVLLGVLALGALYTGFATSGLPRRGRRPNQHTRPLTPTARGARGPRRPPHVLGPSRRAGVQRPIGGSCDAPAA